MNPFDKEVIKMKALYKRLPGHVLVEEFLVPYNADLSDLSRRAKIPLRKLQRLIRGQEKIDTVLAGQLASFYRNEPEYWLDIQERFERGEAL